MKAPQITPGEWVVSEDFNALPESYPHWMTLGIKSVDESPLPTYLLRLEDAEEMEANARFLAASKRMAEAILQRLAADTEKEDAKNKWDDNDLEASRNRMSSAVVSGALADSAMKSALLAAGYTEA